MNYVFKPLSEATWIAVQAIGLVILTELATTDVTTITDVRVWLTALAGASIRAGAGALLARYSPSA